MRVLLHLLLIGLVMLAIGRARALADPAPAADKTRVAKQYVDAGLAAQGTGDYDTALTMYSKAYQLVPHPLLIFNMAQAHRLAGHIDQALTLYARYLAEDPNGAEAATARDLVAELKARKAKTRPDKADKDQPDSGVERVTRPPRNEPSDDGSTGATLIVKARDQSGAAIDDGTVMIDEDPTGKLAGGKLTVTQVAEGRHTVAIEAGGYRRFEETVTVHAGERAHLDALLIENAAPSPPQRTIWNVSLGASAGVMIA
jgi:tetratricopeptide (TPR) repeat protein